MGLRFDPVGGGQFKQALNQIIEVERQPIKNMQARKAEEEAKMKLFQEFKSKFTNFDKTLAELAGFKKFRELKADVGDGANYMSVTLDKDKAETGTYQIEINQLAARTSIISNGFSMADEPTLGIGYVVMRTRDGKSKEIFVDDKDSSLRGVATLINQEKDSPVQASVVKDNSDEDNPWKLILSAKKDGIPGEVDFPDFYFLDGEHDFFVDDTREAQNAIVKMNGFEIEAESNDVKDFLNGVNVHLKQANPDHPIELSITEDFQKISGKMKGLVEQINGILDFINKQNQVDEKTNTRNTFAGDTSLQTVEYRLRNLMHEGFPTGYLNDDDDPKFAFLNQVGVEFDKAGQLTFKEDKFNKVLEGDFEGIAEALTGENGFVNQLRSVVAGYTRPGDGLLSLREQGLRSRIKKIDEDIAQKEQRVEAKQQSLTEQFSRLEASLSNMQKQQQYLNAAMPGGGGGNMVAQLLGG